MEGGVVTEFRAFGTVIACLCLSLLACSSSESSGSSLVGTGLRLNSVADFDASASASLASLIRLATTGVCNDLASPITQDDPMLADGLDCDDDDGIVAHITPTSYSLAFKRVTLVPTDVVGDDAPAIDFIADTGTLANAEVVDFTSDDTSETVITIDPSDLTAGSYSAIETELYYFQMTFPVGGVTRNVRIYMSDDDFEVQGNLGHHQGDITFINDDGEELGWVDSTWGDTLADTRGEDQNGAGGTDAETSHARGFFGNAEFWDAADQVQGAAQDNYLYTVAFDEPLEIPDPDTIDDITTITTTFSVADTFFYEDFAPQGTGFSPGDGGEATAESAAWAPLAPSATLAVE